MRPFLFFLFLGMSLNCLSAQDAFTVPQLTDAQKMEVLYQHVMSYATTGIAFAKTQGTSPREYGSFIGKQFTAFWDPDGGFPVLVNQMMYILAGLHPDNQMEIQEQNDHMIRFRLRNVDLMFREGPVFGVTFDELLETSYGIINEITQFMEADFKHEQADDGWYVVTMTKS